ncbi:MAG: hypothetical protein IPI43_32420 [Sandaracinaceae bacterium]|nr:hypothetical protein [Sandaracinaceae bacterium]
MTRSHLLTAVWGWGFEGDPNILDARGRRAGVPHAGREPHPDAARAQPGWPPARAVACQQPRRSGPHHGRLLALERARVVCWVALALFVAQRRHARWLARRLEGIAAHVQAPGRGALDRGPPVDELPDVVGSCGPP